MLVVTDGAGFVGSNNLASPPNLLPLDAYSASTSSHASLR